jgi:hypothetical protein
MSRKDASRCARDKGGGGSARGAVGAAEDAEGTAGATSALTGPSVGDW